VSPRKGQNVGNAIAVVATDQSKPAHVVICLAEPRDLDQPVLHVSGEALLLLWWLDWLAELRARRNVVAAAGELG
jgi:hypothetical protein